jgi:two-component system phosphate regulon sensor histidine kinase PhoR
MPLPPHRLDREEALGALTEVVDLVNSGESGLPALRRLVILAQRSTGAAGAAFVEYGASGGRIVAVSGVMEWALGRHLNTGLPAVARLLAEGRVHEYPPSELGGDSAVQLGDRGIAWVARAWTQVQGRVVGSLHVYHLGVRALDSADRQRLVFLAALAGNLYRDGRGLPVSSDTPAPVATSDAVVVVGPDGCVRSWNRAAEALTGTPMAEVIGRPLPLPLAGPGQVLQHDLPNGRAVQVVATALPGGESLLLLRDVTAAQRRDASRDLFLAVASHELRTPVTVIKGYAATLADRWDMLSENSRREAVKALGQRAEDLARLVDRLLSGVTDAAGRGQTPLAAFDLSDALRAAVAGLSGEVRRRLRPEIATLPSAFGDMTAVATVLSELATNAVKYSPPGSEVSLTVLADERTVGFRVADRGIGIRSEHVERAFERFWQAESGDQRRYGGVGLGLYLVRTVVERQGGWVSLRPREHGGTVVEVRLPRADVARPAAKT